MAMPMITVSRTGFVTYIANKLKNHYQTFIATIASAKYNWDYLWWFERICQIFCRNTALYSLYYYTELTHIFPINSNQFFNHSKTSAKQCQIYLDLQTQLRRFGYDKNRIILCKISKKIAMDWVRKWDEFGLKMAKAINIWMKSMSLLWIEEGILRYDPN